MERRLSKTKRKTELDTKGKYLYRERRKRIKGKTDMKRGKYKKKKGENGMA